MSAIDTLVDALKAHGCKPHNGAARCPAHDDKVASLTYKVGNKGAVVKCHAGCTTLQVCTAIGLTLKDLFEPRTPSPARVRTDLGEPVARYVYTDENGWNLYRVNRYTPKTFRQEKYTNGTWSWGMEGVRRVIYHLPDVIRAVDRGETVWVVEGEKDVETLLALGIPATCNLGGAGTGKWKDEYSTFLAGASVALVPDDDDVGRAHAEEVRRSLESMGVKVTVVTLGGAKDVSEWVVGKEDPRNALETILGQARATPGPIGPYTLHTFESFVALELPPRVPIVDPVICDGYLVQVHAWRGIGKSMFLMQLALSVACGRKFLKWDVPAPVPVLLVDGEMPLADLQARMLQVAYATDEGDEMLPAPGNFHLLSAMGEPGGIASLATEEGQARFEPYLACAKVLIFDHLSALFASDQDENDASSWTKIQAWFLKLRAMGKIVVWAHHDNKSREQRGTSKREDILSVSIHLKEIDDDTDGTHFKLKFDKHRDLSGTAIAPFEARLTTRAGSMRRQWVISDAEDDTLAEIEEMLQLGKSVRQIATKLKMPVTTVQRKVVKIRERLVGGGQ